MDHWLKTGTLRNVPLKSLSLTLNAATAGPSNAPSENVETESFGVQDISSIAELTQHRNVF